MIYFGIKGQKMMEKKLGHIIFEYEIIAEIKRKVSSHIKYEIEKIFKVRKNQV